MINGIIKLFYTEVVKSKMGNMPKDDYQIKEEFEKVHNISSKIDKVAFILLKVFMVAFVFFILYKVNIYFCVGIVLVSIIYSIYRKSINYKLQNEIVNIKNNLQETSENILRQKGRTNLSLLISILILGLVTKFSWMICLSFFIVLSVTIRDIYINYKKNY